MATYFNSTCSLVVQCREYVHAVCLINTVLRKVIARAKLQSGLSVYCLDYAMRSHRHETRWGQQIAVLQPCGNWVLASLSCGYQGFCE